MSERYCPGLPWTNRSATTADHGVRLCDLSGKLRLILNDAHLHARMRLVQSLKRAYEMPDCNDWRRSRFSQHLGNCVRPHFYVNGWCREKLETAIRAVAGQDVLLEKSLQIGPSPRCS